MLVEKKSGRLEMLQHAIATALRDNRYNFVVGEIESVEVK